ncbi:MAG: HAD-IC family P-type ATPase [Pseudomonadota bacterium]
MPTIEALHTAVEGRARFKIQGLSNSIPLKQLLEIRLNKQKDIVSASASAVTGNLLISYNSGNTPRTIARLIEKILKETRRDLDQMASEMTASKILPALSAPETPVPAIRLTEKTFRIPFALPPAGGKEAYPPWHLLHRDEVPAMLQTDIQCGLTHSIIPDLRKQYGANTLPEASRRSGWQIFFEQINSLPVYLLGAAAGVSILTGGILDAAIIGGVVLANAAIGYVTETKAEKTISSLKNMVRPLAEVIRDGETITISSEDVVIGDILILKPGFYVPADCRIIKSAHLSIDESMLTGESLPASKSSRILKGDYIPLADRTNMAYMGTLITGGQGIAVATATGPLTEIGRLQIMMQDTVAPETPIERQLGRMGDQLVLMCGAVCGLVFLMGFLRGHGFLQMLRTAISLAAAAVPEGLPAAATINFALGINRMRNHQVLIRHLGAVETLGAVQTICLDKTGTITQNKMTVQKIVAGNKQISIEKQRFILGTEPIDPLTFKDLECLIAACFLCNESKINGVSPDGEYELLGTATENALIWMAIHAGVDIHQFQKNYRRMKINHRAENRLFMSTLHTDGKGQRILSVKGSPADVLAMCDHRMMNDQVVPLPPEDCLSIEMENERIAGEGLRVLGVAFRPLEPEEETSETNLIWLGLVGMSDPIRDGVKELIEKFHRAGMNTVMITGDQSSTAYAVANKLRISGDDPLEILDSSQLSIIDPETLKALAKKAHVYARVSPAHKLQIVQALQSAGKIVAMTGDGMNDGPALKAADLGIAMGESGTDVARDVADVILQTDNLEALTFALGDGRNIYTNIRKSVHFFLATNISEILLMFTAMGMNIGFPLNVMQLLWINIISDIFPGLALSMEAPEPGIMERPPRDPKAPLFSGSDYRKMAVESSFITAGALSAYGYGILRYGMGASASSLAFQSLTIGQLLHAISCRSETESLFSKKKIPPNAYLRWAIGGSMALQVMTMVFPPLRQLLGVTRLSLIDTAVIFGSSIAPLFLNEITKKRYQPQNHRNQND